MRLYLAGLEAYLKGKYNIKIPSNALILTSFFYCNSFIIEELIERVGINNILLDSGAFTFRTNKHKTLTKEDYLKYTKKYINFINKYNIKYFFDMDIDEKNRRLFFYFIFKRINRKRNR